MFNSTLGNRLRTSFLRRLYDRLPEAVKDHYRRSRHAPAHWQYHVSPAGKAHARHVLGPLHDCFHGCRAVLMGNGPSLSHTDWSLLRSELTFGTNRIYLLREEMRFDPTIYCSVNHLVLSQFHEDIASVPALKVLDWRHGRRLFPANRSTVFLPESPDHRFHYNLVEQGWNAGFTVTFAAMQLAFYLGVTRLVLIGVDHRFGACGPPMREVTAVSPDRDHFSPEYFGPGLRWHLPHVAGSETSYQLARAAFAAENRQIVDATAGGALDVFPKTSLAAALADPSAPPPSVERLQEFRRLAGAPLR